MSTIELSHAQAMQTRCGLTPTNYGEITLACEVAVVLCNVFNS
jgi:hypothetical protein